VTLYQAEPVEATRWFKNGDHPDDHVGERRVDPVKLGDLRPDLIGPDGWKLVANVDIPDEAYYYRGEGAVVRYFRRPEPRYAGSRLHEVCGERWHDHGWIDEGGEGQTVCPGNWIITDQPGRHRPIEDALFLATHQPVVEGSPP
jgi:hypothetical protein